MPGDEKEMLCNGIAMPGDNTETPYEQKESHHALAATQNTAINPLTKSPSKVLTSSCHMLSKA